MRERQRKSIQNEWPRACSPVCWRRGNLHTKAHIILHVTKCPPSSSLPSFTARTIYLRVFLCLRVCRLLWLPISGHYDDALIKCQSSARTGDTLSTCARGHAMRPICDPVSLCIAGFIVVLLRLKPCIT